MFFNKNSIIYFPKEFTKEKICNIIFMKIKLPMIGKLNIDINKHNFYIKIILLFSNTLCKYLLSSLQVTSFLMLYGIPILHYIDPPIIYNFEINIQLNLGKTCFRIYINL